MPKKWYLSKTIWFNVLSAVAIMATSLIDAKLITDHVAIASAVVGICNVLLRLITNTSVSK